MKISTALALFSLSLAPTALAGDKDAALTTLPQSPLADFANTDAKSVEDFGGQAVLVEFFAFWCKPCAQQVPHMNEIQEKFSKRGFTVLAVTSESDKKATEKFVDEKGVQYPYAYDKKGDWGKQLNVQTIPHAFLVNSRGQIVWSGYPADLSEETIENSLKGSMSTPIGKWPNAGNAVKAAFAKKQYAKAKQAADALAKTNAKDGGDVQKSVDEFVQGWFGIFKSKMSTSDYLSAVELGADLKKELAGLPEGTEIEKALKEIDADKNAQSVIKGQKEVRALRKEKLTKVSDGEVMFPKLAKIVDQYPETAAARDARAFKFEIEHWINRMKQRSEKKAE